MGVVLRPYAVIEAPSILGLKPTGVDGLAQRLLENGLAARVNARYAGRLEPPTYSGEREPETLTLNAHAIASWSPRLADAIGALLERREFPLILGGDCSILLGAMLALRRRGRFGLLFIDGHADFYQPEANPNGEAASMELAFVTGYGPALLTDLEQRRPLVRAEDTVVFGFRDADEQRQYGSQSLPTEILALDLPTVRRIGIELAMRTALERVTRPNLEGFLVHLDADCLDDRIMPAVDYRLPDGFRWDELTSILRHAVGSGRAVGLEVTIYNPGLDEDGSAGRGLTNVLATTLGTSAPWGVVEGPDAGAPGRRKHR
jgi:arginase